jgi:hypothetical protein
MTAASATNTMANRLSRTRAGVSVRVVLSFSLSTSAPLGKPSDTFPDVAEGSARTGKPLGLPKTGSLFIGKWQSRVNCDDSRFGLVAESDALVVGVKEIVDFEFRILNKL